MWFGKNIIARLGLVLAMAVPAFAADVKDMYPLKFGNLNEELQAQYWNDLMSFKMWGTDRIYFTKVTLTDKVGAVGTAGDFDWTGGAGFELGGPVLVEGNFDGGGQEFFTSGPARINGHMLLSGDKENNTLVGTYCVDGDDSGVTVNTITERACERGNNLVDEEGKPLHCELRTGANAKTGPCAEVKPVPKDLFIPTYPFGSAGATNLSSISVGNRVEHFIDVPPVEYDEDGNVTKKMYDYELSQLDLGDGAKFFVRIGSTKSLARFFVNGKISLTSSSTIQVVLVEGGNWDGSKWVGGDTTHVPDTSYAGNLLFYTNDDLKLPSMNGKEILLEGTFMSTKTIDIGSNLYLAGQFLAKEIKISNDLHGEGFRYVPFNASVVRTASGSGNVIVEGREDKVNIVLDKESSTDITFKYCFSFEGTKNTETDYAIGADVSYILVNNVKSSLPLYDPSTKTCSGTPLKSGFKEGSVTLETPIILYANPDGDLEHEYESFKIWILELEGAVLESGERNGAISLRIKDMDAKPNGADYDVNGTEDVPYYFDAFTVTNVKGDAIPNYSVKIKSLPSKGSLVLVDVAGKDSVVLEAGALIPSTAINTDSDVGKFVFRFEKDDYLPKEADNALERYNFDFWVVDGLGNISEDSYTAKVTVAPVNDAPVANDVEFTIKENSVTTSMLTTYADGDIGATDVENDVLTYSFDLTADTRTAEYYEHVAELYDIEPATGKIFVKEGAKLDYESTDSLLYIKVKVTDDGHTTTDPDDALNTTILVSIRMIDVNDPPTVADTTFTIPENLGNDKLVGEVVGKDPDSLNQHGFEHLEYFIDPANTVANAAFKIVDPTKGNITVKNSTKLDYETVPGHKFEFDVLVRNCEYDAVKKDYTANCLEDVVSHVTVELTDEGEPPIIIPICEGDECPTICQGDKCVECKDESCHEECVENCDKPNDPVDVLTVSVNENSPENYEIMRYLVRDEDFDVGHSMALTAEIKNTTVNTGAEDLFGAKMEKDADGNWNVVVYVADSSKLDYETLDFRTHDVTINVRDPEDAEGVHGSLLRVIKVVDVNEPPTVADTTFTIPENLGNDKFVGEVVGKDPDSLNQHGFEHLEYFIDPANMVANAAFKIVDPTKGNITVKNSTKLDYETVPGHKFEFDVFVRNCEYDAVKKDYTANCLEDVVSHVTVELTDEGEPPIIIPICEGDECPTICQGDKCVECKDESCHEECVENCDKPNDPVDVLTVSVNENSRQNYEIMRYLVRDEDYGVGHTKALTAEIKNTTVNTGAEDLFGAKMEKDADGNWNVVVYVADSSKLDYETLDFYTHDVTINVRDPKDAEGVHGSLLRVIKVVDVNEAPTITGVEDLNGDYKDAKDDFTFYPKEDLVAGGPVGYVHTDDPDVKHLSEFGYREFSLDNPNNYPFEMKDSLLVLTKKLDYEKDSREYTFDIIVNNCERAKNSAGKYEKINPPKCTEPVKQAVTVKLQDVNEKPIIIVDKGPDGTDDSDPYCIAHCDTTSRGVWKDSILTIGVRENTEDGRIYSETGKVLFVYHYADEDTGHVAGAKVTWFDSSTTIPSVSTKGTDLFKLDYSNGTITVSVKDEKLLDYEALRNAKNRDDPDPEYLIGIVVTDPKGMADTLLRKIRVTDENEKPLYTPEPCVVVEGNHPGDSIGHVEHPSDVDSLSRNPALYDNYFKMTDVSHKDVFELRKDSTDLMRVILAALDSIDCEDGSYICGVDSVYWVELTYGDTTLKTVYNNIKIPVKVLDKNEAPIIKTDTIGVDENSSKGTPVDSIRWFDYDVFDKEGLHFEISSDPSGCFEIDPKTGFVTVKKDKCSALDHEKNPTLEIEVSVTDMVYVTDASMIYGGPNTVKKTIKVNVHDVNEPPHLDDTTFTVSEFKKPGTVIDTVVGHDLDTKNPEYSKLTYSMVKGDSSKFKVNPTTGEIVLLDSLDYETKNEYKIDVRVYDGEFADMATITIKVKNEIEKTHVRITIVDDSAKVWNDPEVIYTNNPGREICWEQENDTICQNIHITKDTVVTIEYKNPKKDSAGVDKVIIYYSNAAPMVTISAKPTQVSADNIFTILEKMGDDDSTVYVNDVKNNIYITIRDTANKNTKVDTSFKMPIVLDAVKIENKVYDKVESIIKAGVYLDETKPSKEVTRVPTNGNTVKVSYKEVVGNDTVTVTYETDKNGDVLKSMVIGDDGKEQSWEVITVSYVTKVKINGKEENVTISYQADAATGQVLEQDPEGNLMTASAAEAKRKEAKKNAAKADSTKSKNESTVSDFSTGRFSIAYSYTVKQYVAGELIESSVDVSYVVNGKGELAKNADGDRGYSVKYTYTNIFGNAAEQSLFIVLDQVLPKVEIRSPVDYQEIRSNYVNVEWYVNGQIQDTLTVQGLEKGVNMIVRFYRDKAGNEASDTVFVVMKDSKDIELSVVNPVTEINPDKVAEFYSGDNAKFAPEKGQTYSVSILSTSGKEIETLKGGRFDAKAAGGEELYPDQKQKHLGPTLGLKVQLPVVKPDNKSGTVSGLATMDDLMCHGKINLEEVCNENTKTMGVEEYVAKYCDADVSASDDLSSINLYNSRITVKIWIYTSLGGFVDYYRFSHDLNEPDYTNEAGLLQMFFELKPDREGFVHSESGKLYSTGAYLYKVEASVNSVPRCDVMPMKASSHKRGEKIKSSDDLLKPFGYKRPKQK